MREVARSFGGLVTPRLRSRPSLLAIAIGLPVLEAALLWVFAPRSTLALAVHVTAPEPFAVFHDLRWILVYHSGWTAFASEAVLFLAFRTTVTAAVLRQAWPKEAGTPPWPVLFRRSLVFTAVTGLLLSPWAALAFGIAVISLSWLFFVAIPLMLLTAVLLHHGVVTGSWWRQVPPLRTVGWVLLSFVGLTLGGALVTAGPVALRFPALVASGAFNAWAWHGIVRGIVCREPVLRALPLAPVGVAALVGIAAVGTALGFELARPHTHPFDRTALGDGGKPVLVVAGFGSSWSGRAQERFGATFDERRFSYAGLDSDERALPYTAADTLGDLLDLTSRMAQQVEAFHRDAGEPISIVAESEGALLAKAYLTSKPHAPVDRLVMLSPLVRPARVYYPPDGQDGWGVATALELRGLAAVIRGLTPMTIDTDTALFASVNEHGGALRSVLPCPLAGVEELLIAPIADAVASAEFDAGGLRVIDVPDWHGGLLSDGAVRNLVAAELRGEDPDGSEAWSVGARGLRALAAGWQVPELKASLNPAWEEQEDGGCADVRSHLRAWAAPS